MIHRDFRLNDIWIYETDQLRGVEMLRDGHDRLHEATPAQGEVTCRGSSGSSGKSRIRRRVGAWERVN